jgi:hypothetical protein
MEVFSFLPTDDAEAVAPLELADTMLYVGLDGRSQRASWSPMHVSVISTDERGNRLPEGDFLWLGSKALIVRERGLMALEPVLEPYGEFLELRCDDAALWIFNCTKMVHALNISKSKIQYDEFGRIVTVRRHVFDRNVVDDLILFSVREYIGGPIYVTRKFIDIVNESKLTGLEFELLWKG